VGVGAWVGGWVWVWVCFGVVGGVWWECVRHNIVAQLPCFVVFCYDSYALCHVAIARGSTFSHVALFGGDQTAWEA